MATIHATAAAVSARRLWHTIRHPNGTWQNFFGLVESQESNDPGKFNDVACAGVGNELQLSGIGPNGKIWHTIRVANGSWQPFFGLVDAQESNHPGPFSSIGSAGVGNQMQLVAIGPGGKLWHTIRNPNGSWQSFFGLVESQEVNDPGAFTDVACGGVGNEMQLVAIGPGGKLWHTIRHANGSWQNFFGLIESQESNDPGMFHDVGCAGVNGELQVVGIGPQGRLWHTIRHANGSWQPSFGLVDAQESNHPGPFSAVACAGVNNELHVIAVGPGGKLWHTIRHTNGSWQSAFGLIESQEVNDPGAFLAAAGAGVGTELQVVGIV